MKTLVVIPARKNSKGLPGKNTIPCAGKPLVEWTLDLLPDLDLPDFRAVVSTDCPKVAACAHRNGVMVLQRPAYLATDDATTIAVLQHAVQAERAIGHEPEAVLLLQPTNPLRTVQDISAAYRIMVQNELCDTVMSFVEATSRESTLLAMPADEFVWFANGSFNRRQDCCKMLKRTGEIYLYKRDVVEDGFRYNDHTTRPYIIPRSRAWNIDEPCDIPIVEALLRFNGRV